MVVMDREDYTNKAHSLLADNTTYKITTKGPTKKLKINFSKYLGILKTKENYSYQKKSTQPVQLPQAFMAFQKNIK